MTATAASCGVGAKLVTLGLPGRADRGVELDETISALIAADAPIAVGVSGGKDSVAAALAVFEHLDSVGHAGPRILIHADLGDSDPRFDVEWSDSLPTCRRLAARLGVELVIARRASGGMMKRWIQRWEANVRRYANLSCVRMILPWSTPSMRFCTSELKSEPMARALVRRFAGHTIISACGVRRSESKERASALTSEPNKRLAKKTFRTTGVDWNPIAHWSEQDVYAFCAARGFDLHEGYTRFGMSRISCRFCIMANGDDLKSSAACNDNAPVYCEMVRLEARSTFAFQGAKWLGDLAPHLLGEELSAELAAAKERGKARKAIEKRIPDHLLYTRGWPTVMPTREEAEMLAEVRTAVAGLLDIAVRHTDADSIIARYAELMAKNAAREAAKLAKEERKLARVARRKAAA